MEANFYDEFNRRYNKRNNIILFCFGLRGMGLTRKNLTLFMVIFLFGMVFVGLVSFSNISASIALNNVLFDKHGRTFTFKLVSQ